MAQISVGITREGLIVLETTEGAHVTITHLTPAEAGEIARALRMAASAVQNPQRR